MIKVTAAIYSLMLIVLIPFITVNFESIAADSYLIIGFLIITPYTLFMLLRALYLIFETVEIDEEKREITLRILRKSFAQDTVKAIKKVRPGQLRLETTSGTYPFSVEEEEEFIKRFKNIFSQAAIY
jgi:hypothetical protein